MADMYGAIRSNEFTVKDYDEFVKWFREYHFGDFVELWRDKDNEDGSTTVSFGGEVQYPNAYPSIHILDDDGDIIDETQPDLEHFAREVREHLMPGEFFQIVAGGNEKLRYVGFSELIIAEESDVTSYQNYYSDDSKSVLKKRLGLTS